MLKVTKLHKDAKLPVKAHKTDAGFDLTAISFSVNINNPTGFYSMDYETNQDSIDVRSGNIYKAYTGIGIEIPNGYYGRIAPRSGLSVKHGIDILAGVIDVGYTGEIIVIFTTHKTINPNTYSICTKFIKFDKIAQLIIEKISPINECYFFENNKVETSEDSNTTEDSENNIIECNNIEEFKNKVKKNLENKLRGDNGFGSTS